MFDEENPYVKLEDNKPEEKEKNEEQSLCQEGIERFCITFYFIIGSFHAIFLFWLMESMLMSTCEFGGDTCILVNGFFKMILMFGMAIYSVFWPIMDIILLIMFAYSIFREDTHCLFAFCI